MYYYFSCEYPAVIKLNGVYYGLIGDAVKCVNSLDEQTFVEICPISGKYNGVNFMLSKDFLTCEHNLVSVTDLKGGYLLKIKEPTASGEFKIIAQQKYNDAVVTLFNDNGVKLSLETPNDFYADNFDFLVTSGEIFRVDTFSSPVICTVLHGKHDYLSAYLITDKIIKVFYDQVDGYSFSSGISTTKKYVDILKHTVTCEWALSNATLTVKESHLTYGKELNLDKMPELLIPYAFFEELLVGGKVSEFLSDDMQKNERLLKGYLGDFIGVMPPPTFRDVSQVGLIYPNGKNGYTVNYYKCAIENKKISNISKCED